MALAHSEALTSGVSLGAGALALGVGVQAPASLAPLGVGVQAPASSAALEQCVTAVSQDERSVTFSGEMTAIPGSVRLAIRIEVQEQLPGEAPFHTIAAPGLGAWRSSDPGVKTYRYLKQVTNLSAPAVYRAAVRFRWLNADGRAIKVVERHTPRCEQPAPPPAPSSGSAVALVP